MAPLASVPTPQLDLSQQPKSDVTGAVFNRPLPVSIAPGLEQLGEGAGDLATSLAKQQAQQDVASFTASNPDPSKVAVTLDANGQPQVASPLNSVILGRAGEAYHEAATQGMLAAYRPQLASDVLDLRSKYPDDPQTFQAAVKARADAARAQWGSTDFGNAVADEINNLGAQHYSNMVEGDIRRNTLESLQAIQTQIDSTKSEMASIARQGAINTPRYDQLQDRLQDSFDALSSNKLFGYSQEKIDAEQTNAFNELNGWYVVGRIDDTFNRKGKGAALDVVKDQIDNNPDLKVTDAERNELHNYAMSRLSYLSTENASALAALKPTVDMQTKTLLGGNNGPDRVSDQEVSSTIAQLRGLGAFKESQQLQAAQIVADRTAAFRFLMPDQKAAVLLGAGQAGVGGPIASGVNSEQGALQYFQSKGWSQAQASGIVGNLIRESGLNAGAVNRGDGSDGSDSIGIGQWNSDRAQNLRTFAAAQGKPVTDLGTQLAFVQHELETSESPAAARLRAAQTPQDAAAAFALGYERPQGFQTGDMSKVAGGQDRIDQAARLAGGGASSAAVANSGPGLTSFGQPFTDAEAQANPWLRTAYRQSIKLDDATQIQFAKNQFEALDNSIKFSGGSLSPDIIGPAATALQIADRFPDKLGTQAATLRGALAGQPAGFAAAGSPDQGTSLLNATEELARHGDPLGNAIYSHVQAGIEQGRKLLADDVYEYGRQAEILPRKPIPLNFTDSGALQQGMNERAIGAAKMAEAQGLQGIGAFAKNELPVVKSIAQDGTLDQKTALVSSIVNAHMSQPVFEATMKQLGADPTTSPLAIAGDVARNAPGVARDILDGQQLMRADPKLVPKDIKDELATAIPFNDMPDGAMRQAYGTAINAYYAKLAANAGNTTGIVDSNLYDRAVKDVTGGVVEWRGSKAFAPWYGASQEQFDASVRSLTDADLAGSRGSDNIPLPASYLRPSVAGVFSSNARWRLESYGDGKYLVYSGPDDHAQRQYLQSATGGKFVLDLGAKRAQVEAQGIGSASPSPFSSLPYSQYLSAGSMAGPL